MKVAGKKPLVVFLFLLFTGASLFFVELVVPDDPPNGNGNPNGLGWELLKDGTVFHMWNQYDDYYFNRSNGVQFSNHYEEYWTHSVLMIGYLTGGNLTDPNDWNLIYRVDELSGFNEDLVNTSEYINVTLWRNLNYGGYDFRLAIRYHLGVNDTNLTVVPYVKNLGIEIPFTIGFGWEMRDIKVENTSEYDFIRLYNGTGWEEYFLNQTLNKTYTNMDYNTTFTILDNDSSIPGRRGLSLQWKHTLDYLLWVKNRTMQYNAPVTLFIKVGTLGVDQEKYTRMYWHDDIWVNPDSTYEGPADDWTDDDNCIDGNTGTYAYTTNAGADLEVLLNPPCITCNKIRIYCCNTLGPGEVDATNIDIDVYYGDPVPTWHNVANDVTITANTYTEYSLGGYKSVTKARFHDDSISLNEFRVKVFQFNSPLIINFAGNLSDSGGPYWRPPYELVQLTGTYSDGYYTNDSRQHESWIYIHITGTAGRYFLNWLNGTTWTNGSGAGYLFSNTAGNYWEYNTSGAGGEARIETCCGYNYSFDIEDDLGNINRWEKTGIGGGQTRRWVQLNCSTVNISYGPYYLYDYTSETGLYSIGDIQSKDRLHHDQGPDGSVLDTGYLVSTLPTDIVHERWCSNFVGYWFEDSTCIQPFTLSNLYYHIWWSADDDTAPFGWYKSRQQIDITTTNETTLDKAESRSEIGYSGKAPNIKWFLNTGLLDTANTAFTDNDIYELVVKLYDVPVQRPGVISNRSFMSFVFFNVPDNATLNASYSDSDGDLLSDWTELYVNYTNPFIADTDNDGVDDCNECKSGSDPNDWRDTKANTAPTITGEIPSNQSVGISTTPTLNVTVDDANDNTLDAYWYSNSSGPWVLFGSNLSIDTSSGGVIISQINTNFTSYYHTYYWSVNSTDGCLWTNETYHFRTEDKVTITFISQTPANIRTNTTGYVEIVFNVTTGGTPINTSSLLFAHVINHTINGYCLNWSWRLPVSIHQPDKKRACNRNEDLWFEKFNSTGTGEIGAIGEWGCHDYTTALKLTIEASGSNWTRVNFNSTVHHMTSNIWYVDRTDMQDENKTTKILDVYGKYAVRTFYNMTDTCYYDAPLYNNSLHFVYFYYGYDGLPNKVMNVYFANSSYTTGDYQTSPNCEMIGSVNMNTAPIYTIRNSTYYQLQFSTNATGWVDGIKLTSNYSLIFASETSTSKKYYVYYADSNISHADHYHDFYNASVTQTTSDDGDTWTGFNGAVDVHIKYVNLDDTDNIQYKFYANDTSENEAWSSVYGDLIDVTNYPPSCANIIKPNGTVDYNVSDVINITYRWAGDPNQETCWINITCHDSAHSLIAYIQNRSITDAESRATEEFYYDWDTTGVAAGINHSLNFTATDPYGLNCTSTSAAFNLTHMFVFDINRTSFAFGVVQNDAMVYSNATEPDTFRIYNNGTCSIDIDVNGTNATASGITDWNLSSSNGDNQYKLEIYNSSTGWIQINKTADTWYSNMPQLTNMAANIRITTPTIFYSGKQMTCIVYMTASIH